MRHPIPIKRQRRQALGWAGLAGALLVLLIALLCCRIPGEAEEIEVMIHPQEIPVVIVTAAPEIYKAPFSEEEIAAAARTVWGEARGIPSRMEQAAIVWCALNRVDAGGGSLGEVVTAPAQFAYSATAPTVDDYGRDLRELVRDVIGRWEREKNGETDVGRVLPAEYLYFGGENGRNWFRPDYESFADLWDWSLPDPY